jgi:cyanate permease
MSSSLPSLLIQQEFTRPSSAPRLGLSPAIGQVSYSAVPALLGVVHDLSGGYRVVLAVCMSLPVLAALLVMSGINNNRESVSAAVLSE